MANCIAKARGYDKSREKETHRLGSEAAEATAATFQTFATAYVNKDGSGWLKVTRNYETLHEYHFEKEGK